MLIKIRNLNKTYFSETKTITRALEDINLDFKETGLNFIVGESGSGKSTLLNVIGAIDAFDSGNVIVANHSLNSMNSNELDYYRNSMIGFVFQELNLLEDFNVRENIKIALDINSIENEDKIDSVIQKLGLKDIEFNNVKDISTGQKQRVAIARTLIKDASIILADEPTGSLDSKNGIEVLSVLKEIAKEKLVIVISHDLELAKTYADRIIELKDGKVIKDIEKGISKDKNIKVLSKNLLKINKIDDEVVQKLNNIKDEYNQKVYISSEKNIRKTKAIFKEATFEDNKEEDGFKVVEPLKEKMKDVRINKSKLKIKRLLKLAYFNLFNKKKILILTSILMIVSLLLYGVSEGFSNYNKVDAYIETINKEKFKSINLIEIKNKDKYQKVSESNITLLKENYKDINISKEYLLPLKLNLNKTINGSKKYSITGVSEVNDVSKYYNLKYGSSNINNYNEIIISEYLADILIKGEYYDISNISELIDKEIVLNEVNHKIVGIIESNYFSSSKESVNDYLEIRDNIIFVKEGFMDNYINNLKYIEYSLDIYLQDNSNSYDPENLSLANVIFDDYSSNYSLTFNYFNSEKTNLLENEILISQSFIESYDLCNDECNENSFINNELVLTYNSNIIYAFNNYKVVGTYSYLPSNNEIDNNLYSNSIIISSTLKEEINKNIYYNYELLTGLTNNDSYNEDFIKYAYSLGLSINKNFTSAYDKYSEMIISLSDVLNTLSFIMLVISIFLLYSFIQNSILISKRKIGILKSLGVNDLNVFSIFLIETLLVTLIAILGSSSLILITSPIINLIVRGNYGFYFSAININIFIFLKIISITVLVALIALIIPFIKFKKMSTNELIGSR